MRVLIFVIFILVSFSSHSQLINKKQKVDLLNTKSENILFSYPDSAFIYAKEAFQIAVDNSYLEGEAKSSHLLGMVFFHQGVYIEALDDLLHAEKIYRILNDQYHIAENLNQQGLIYYNTKQAELAFQTHNEALSIYEVLQEKKGIAYSLGCIGRLYEKKEEYDKALDYQERALLKYKEINYKQGEATIFENIGSIYEDMEEYEKAMIYFKSSIEINKLLGDSLSMIVNLNNIGDLYRKTANYKTAIAFTGQALDISIRLKNRYQQSSAYKDLGKTYFLMGEFENAYLNLENGRKMYEEIYTTETARQLTLIQTLFETEQKNNEILILEKNKRLDVVIKICLVLSIIFLCVLAFVVIRWQRVKILRNKELLAHSEKIHEAEKRVMNTSLEKKRLEEEHLKEQLSGRAKSLTAHTLHIIGKNQILEDVRDKILSLLEQDEKTQKRQLRELVKIIDNSFTQDKDWDDFRHIFEQVHQDFFDILHKTSNDLTPSDLRLAALIKMNMSTKDISTLLGISSDSLRIARYRLKKKLNLSQDTSLSNFIFNI